jgi:gamma-glutamylcyclotransferase (GGCT)/AIG2-like uncharacterized protein YtfP
MSGQGGQQLAGVNGQLTFVGACSLPGVLYDLGDYPGLIEGEGIVRAEIYSLPDKAALAKLDAYEGFQEGDPTALFIRRRISIDSENPECWVYYYNRDLTGHLPLKTGDWMSYRERK